MRICFSLHLFIIYSGDSFKCFVHWVFFIARKKLQINKNRLENKRRKKSLKVIQRKKSYEFNIIIEHRIISR